MTARFLQAIALVLIPLTTGGCALNQPSYDTVRAEAVAALDEIAALVPPPHEVSPEPDDEPYSCSDPLLSSRRGGAFYTGQWAVYVSDGFDFDTFIADLPGRLGDGWEERDLGIAVSFASVYLVNHEHELSVTVDEAEIDGRPALDLIVISRCGILPTDDKPRTSPGGRGV